MARSFSGKSSNSKSSTSKGNKSKSSPKIVKVPSMFVNHGALKVKVTKQKN
ncbi:MAG: hypothetical protein P8Z35_25890 [Ignavibacteriaceae bacterium]